MNLAALLMKRNQGGMLAHDHVTFPLCFSLLSSHGYICICSIFEVYMWVGILYTLYILMCYMQWVWVYGGGLCLFGLSLCEIGCICACHCVNMLCFLCVCANLHFHVYVFLLSDYVNMIINQSLMEVIHGFLKCRSICPFLWDKWYTSGSLAIEYRLWCHQISDVP